jgi:UDP-N-acetyl-D-glucosamine dehydrogenase
LDSGNYTPKDTFESISHADVIVICVPTPLDENLKPDLTYILKALAEIVKFINRGSLVILESTVAPGTTRSLISGFITSNSKLNSEEFYVAFSPERIDPSNENWKVENTPKLVSGINDLSCKKAINFYSRFIANIHKCDSLEIAETAKLFENSYRLVNISLVNELSKFCYVLGIDVNKVIDAAATKPYGFMRFNPSVGVGGHCIPVDPKYLTDAANNIGSPFKLIELAFLINLEMAQFYLLRAETILGNLENKRILIVGVAYKPNVSDVRETAVKPLIELLRTKNAIVSWHDDLVKNWNGEKSSTISNDFDLAIIATKHDNLDFSKLENVQVLDTSTSI